MRWFILLPVLLLGCGGDLPQTEEENPVATDEQILLLGICEQFCQVQESCSHLDATACYVERCNTFALDPPDRCLIEFVEFYWCRRDVLTLDCSIDDADICRDQYMSFFCTEEHLHRLQCGVRS